MVAGASEAGSYLEEGDILGPGDTKVFRFATSNPSPHFRVSHRALVEYDESFGDGLASGITVDPHRVISSTAADGSRSVGTLDACGSVTLNKGRYRLEPSGPPEGAFGWVRILGIQ